MATESPRRLLPGTLGAWIAVLVGLVAAVVLILLLLGVAAATPAWLPWLLIAASALAILIG